MIQKHSFQVERITVDTTKSFEEVLEIFASGISRPDVTTLREIVTSHLEYSEFKQHVEKAQGSAGLLEFLRLDLGAVLFRDPGVAHPYRMLRIIAGNPLTMKEMARHVPDVGSYAPVTILVFEGDGKTHIRYDTMESLLKPYGSLEAVDVARDLDAKVMGLIERATPNN